MKMGASVLAALGITMFLIMGTGFALAACNDGGTNTCYGTDTDHSIGAGSGTGDSFFGYRAGFTNSNGNYNSFFGAYAGISNTASNNTFIGYTAGYSNNTGHDNVFAGYKSGYTNTSGNNNVFIGISAGQNNTTSNNTFVGASAGLNNNSGTDNAFYGFEAGKGNTDGADNVFIGTYAGNANTSGHDNTYIGYGAGFENTGSGNIFIGSYAGYFVTGANDRLYIDNCYTGSCTNPLIYGEFDNQLVKINGSLSVTTGGITFPDGHTQTTAAVTGAAITSLGNSAGLSGANNTFIGASAGHSTTGSDNTFVGSQSGASNVGGIQNSFFGISSGGLSTTGSWNAFFGYFAGNANKAGNYNVAFGYEAGNSNDAGHRNTSIGAQAGNNNKGSGNVFIGYQAGYTENSDNKLYIDNCYLGGNGVCNQPLIYGEFDNRIVRINGKLVFASDERLKKNIEPLTASLDKIMNLKGVSYEWRTDENPGQGFSKEREIGLIAQDVEKVIPELVYTDDRGYKSMSYDKVVPVLVEAIKEQQGVIKKLSEKLEKLDRLEAELKTFKSKDITAQK